MVARRICSPGYSSAATPIVLKSGRMKPTLSAVSMLPLASTSRAAMAPPAGPTAAAKILPDRGHIETLHIGPGPPSWHHHPQNDIGLLGAVGGLLVVAGCFRSQAVPAS